jgi:hypothetical protein
VLRSLFLLVFSQAVGTQDRAPTTCSRWEARKTEGLAQQGLAMLRKLADEIHECVQQVEARQKLRAEQERENSN